MGKQQKKFIHSLTGQFLGWGDDRLPHRYIKLATVNGEQVVKIAKSLRPLTQDWQPGIWLTLLGQKQVNLATGKTSIKVKQLLSPPKGLPFPGTSERQANVDRGYSVVTATSTVPTEIQVCQGSSCRRKGSERICRTMQTYLDRHNLTKQVEIKPVKCLHQCKAAPHTIFIQPDNNRKPEKTHYRQLETYQLEKILTKHFPNFSLVGSSPQTNSSDNEYNLIDKIGNYLHQQIGSTTTALRNSSY
jgi:(2Fe-2S) ferredoxin